MIIAVTNLKGGVGKTTIARNLAVCFAHMDKSVCIVDTDTNQNSLAWSGVRDTDLPNVTVVGCTDPKALKKATDDMAKLHDIVVIDGTPSLGEMTTRIIMVCNLLLIPILPSADDFRSMEHFFERLSQAKEFKEVIPAYFIINQYSPHVKVYKGMRQLLPDFDIDILESTLAKRAVYAEAALEGKGVIECEDEKAKAELVALTNEIIEKMKSLKLIQ